MKNYQKHLLDRQDPQDPQDQDSKGGETKTSKKRHQTVKRVKVKIGGEEITHKNVTK